MVHVKQKGKNLEACMLCWDYFVLLMKNLKEGCDDNDPDSIETHAKRVEALCENMIEAFLKAGLAMNRVTVYMHIAQAHLPEQIRRAGSMSKGSSQGAEHLHQDMQDLTKRHTSKHADNVCGTTLEKVHGKLEAMQDPNFGTRRGTTKISEPGGHLSKMDKLMRDETYNKAEAKLGETAYNRKEEEAHDDVDALGNDDNSEDCNMCDDHEWPSTSSSEDESGDGSDDDEMYSNEGDTNSD